MVSTCRSSCGSMDTVSLVLIASSFSGWRRPRQRRRCEGCKSRFVLFVRVSSVKGKLYFLPQIAIDTTQTHYCLPMSDIILVISHVRTHMSFCLSTSYWFDVKNVMSYTSEHQPDEAISESDSWWIVGPLSIKSEQSTPKQS